MKNKVQIDFYKTVKFGVEINIKHFTITPKVNAHTPVETYYN